MVVGEPSRLVGVAVKRKEDPRLITGEGSYIDDVHLPGIVYMAVLRSLHAHARIVRLDVSRARQHPEVLDILTGEQVKERCKTPHPLFGLAEGAKVKERWPLATGIANYVGDPVAAVVAGSAAAGRDALDLIDVDYDPIPVVVDPESALEEGSPLVHEELGTNLVLSGSGSAGDPDAAFREADGVVSLRLVEPRIVVNPMEPRGVLVSYERSSGSMTVWDSTQTPHLERTEIAGMLGVHENKIRVIARDVGGGFGCKFHTYPETILAALFSIQLSRPVKWVEERQEHFVSTIHGHGEIQYVEAAYKKDGTLTGMRLSYRNDLAAYSDGSAHYYMGAFTHSMAPGPYRTKHLVWDTAAIYTNKTPVGPYRGYGRHATAYFLERVMDLIARDLNMDPVAIRRRNLIHRDEFPYSSPTGMEYDSGDYEASLDKALEVADYAKLREEQVRLRQQGILMGIGIATSTERTGSAPSGTISILPGFESATVRGPGGQGDGAYRGLATWPGDADHLRSASGG